MDEWKVRFFEPKEIMECYEWIRHSDFHIALHLNPYVKKTAYHVFGSNKRTLVQFGRLAKCYPRMFSVMDTHGTKKRYDHIVYHYDDYRCGVTEKYKQLKSILEKAYERSNGPGREGN